MPHNITLKKVRTIVHEIFWNIIHTLYQYMVVQYNALCRAVFKNIQRRVYIENTWRKNMIQWLNANVWNFKPCVEYTVLCCWYNTIQIYVHGFVNNYAFIISVSSANLNNGVTPPMMMYPPLAIIYYLVLFLLRGLNHIHHIIFYELDTRTLRYFS